jgi:uroporphyrin-3 C-methyltransferase
MSAEPETTPVPESATLQASDPGVAAPANAAAGRPAPLAAERTVSRPLVMTVGVLAAVAVVSSVWLWQKLSGIQEQLARQSHDTSEQAIEAKAMAKQAQELARDTAARLALTDSKLNEVALQRSQLEELMQSLSRSRDENLVVDIDSAIRLAQQQAQLTGSVQPLLVALRSAEARLTKLSHPRLAPLQRALTRDIERVKTASVADTPGLLIRLDELARWVDDLPLANAVVVSEPKPPLEAPVATSSWARAVSASWWEGVLSAMWEDVRSLVRVSRIDRPEASLLAPEQSYFLRENLKLRLLNARLALLTRHHEAARQDLTQVQHDLERYFDAGSRRGLAAQAALRQVLADSKQIELPRIDETLAALATAAAGR